MAKKSKKSKQSRTRRRGQRLAKGETLYNPELAERAKSIIIEAQLIKADGSLHYMRLAKILGVPSRTMSHWRNAASQYYQPAFVKALTAAHKELLESLQAGKIKRAMVQRATSYTNVKTIKEKVVRGPKVPAMSSLDKKALQLIAIKLGVKIDKVMTKGILRVKIAEEVMNQTKEVLVTTRQEVMRMHGDPSAAKLALPHLGPKDERWVPQEKLEVEGRSLADIAAIMSGKKVG